MKRLEIEKVLYDIDPVRNSLLTTRIVLKYCRVQRREIGPIIAYS